MLVPVQTSADEITPHQPIRFEPTSPFAFILSGANRQYYAEWTGQLSLKHFYNGEAYYNVGPGRYTVREGEYLLLNAGQRYSITVDAKNSVESFCIFFPPGFAESIFSTLQGEADTLLDRQDSLAATTIHFVPRLYQSTPLLSQELGRIRRAIVQGHYEAGWLQERLYVVMQGLLQTHTGVLREMEKLPNLRPGTRQELYRRLYRARDYAAASLHQPVTLAELARIACLSPNHLLRTFKQLFNCTPHQYRTSLRLRRAEQLLLKTDLPITDICYEIGFESLGSFSSLFRRHFGNSPAQHRQQKGDFREADRARLDLQSPPDRFKLRGDCDEEAEP